MRRRHALLLTILMAGTVTPAISADQLKFGNAPAWVVPQQVPSPPVKPSEAPVAMLLHDQQVLFEPGKTTTYGELAFRIQNEQGLAAGNVSVAWQPATDVVTVNKLQIRRGNQTIDVIAAGQTFTTMRREQNLEFAILDGMLTANIQPEGLQQGDIINLATTTEHVDPVMKGHVEVNFGQWNEVPFELAHARLEWPANTELKVRQSAGLPGAQPVNRNGRNVLEISASKIEPSLPPKGAPIRYTLGRFGEASDFQSWAAVADLMIPLYRDAAVISASGPLHDEVEKIRIATRDPRLRAEKALDLVQNRVRYVALLMGQGGYVPASAEATWSRRFGDCKAKTALLLAMLDALDVDSDPVLVNVGAGDAIADRLPMIGVFNHVLLRAQIGGKPYWLDGTRTGDTSLDQIEVPNLRWGLPLVGNAKLVPIMPEARNRPDSETVINIDASGGVRAPAPTTIQVTYRGDGARVLNAMYAARPTAQVDQMLRDYWKRNYDLTTIKSATFAYDKAKSEMRLDAIGDTKLKWRDGWYMVPNSSIAYDPDFDRAAGPLHDAPFAISFPSYERSHVSLRLPPKFTSQQKMPAPVKETLAGVAYERNVTLTDGVLLLETVERSLVPEVPYKVAIASEARLRALDDTAVQLRMPDGYAPTEKDISALASEQPSSAYEFRERGGVFLATQKFDEAIADFTQAATLDVKDPWAPANRAVARVSKGDLAAAEKDIATSEALDPNNWVAAQARGLLAETKGEYGKAIEAFTKVLQSQPNNIFTLNRRAFAHASQENFEAAEKDLKTVEASLPGDPSQLPTRAKIAEAKGDYKAAVEAYSKLIEAAPENMYAMVGRIKAYRNLGEDNKVLFESEKILKSNPENPELRLIRANIYMQRNDKAAAVREADILSRDGAKSDYAQVAAARIYARAGTRAQAEQAFDRALAIKPQAYIYLNRAQSLPLSNTSGRMAHLDAALKLEPDFPEALAEKAWELSRKGEHEAALRLYEQAVKAAPEAKYLLYGRAVMLHKVGRTAEAAKIFAELRSRAKAPYEFNSLCWTKATERILVESALEDCREAIRLSPDTIGYQDSLGMALLQLGKLDDALAAYNKVIAKRAVAASLMGRAIIHARKGEMTRAQADVVEARKLDADIEARFAEYGLKFEAQTKVARP